VPSFEVTISMKFSFVKLAYYLLYTI
jgi:hypothetical protein